MIKVKRIYEEPARDDGYRILVDRLWPRGMSKEHARVDLWLKEIAPTTELRKWFSHEKKKWEEFRRRYVRELNANDQAIGTIFDAEKREGTVTLLYSAKEQTLNQAIVLQQYLQDKR